MRDFDLPRERSTDVRTKNNRLGSDTGGCGGRWILNAILVALLSALFGLPLARMFEEAFLRHSLAKDVEGFYQVVLNGRAVAMDTQQYVGFRLSATGWIAFSDAAEPRGERAPSEKAIDSRMWKRETKVASNVTHKSFYFSHDGHCYLPGEVRCVEPSLSEDSPPGHQISWVSTARRIYTLTFDAAGHPDLVYDDF